MNVIRDLALRENMSRLITRIFDSGNGFGETRELLPVCKKVSVAEGAVQDSSGPSLFNYTLNSAESVVNPQTHL